MMSDVCLVKGSRRLQEEPIDVKIRLNRGDSLDDEEDDLQEGYREGQQKRKQDTIIAELREKAQVSRHLGVTLPLFFS